MSGLKQRDWQPVHWFWLLCLCQVIFWTMGPWFIRENPVYDTMESIVWGNMWQWGYDKHPPFTAWVTGVLDWFWPGVHFQVYLFAQFCVLLTFLAVGVLAKEYLEARGRLLAVFLLTSILFYCNRVERFTPDTLQNPLWAWLVVSVYFSVTRQKIRYWLAAGILTGLCLLTKYQAVLILVALFVALVSSEQGRRCLRTPAPWLAFSLGFILFLPHLLWLIENDFSCLLYFEDEFLNKPLNYRAYYSWTDHLKSPAVFVLSTLGNIAPLFIVMWPLYRGSRRQQFCGSFEQCFLLAVCFVPFILSLSFGLISGRHVVPRWATPYFAWLPLTFLVFFPLQLTTRKVCQTLNSCIIFFLLFWTGRMTHLYISPIYSSKAWKNDVSAPLKEEMAKAELLWHKFSELPLPYIAGLHYHAVGLTAYRSSPLTIPFLGLSESESRWMKKDDFYREGGMIVLNRGRKGYDDIVTRVEKEYSGALYLGTFSFKPLRVEKAKKPTLSVSDYYLVPPQMTTITMKEKSRN
ncbi:hypothetical protein CI610_01581 [invertebrate metagenome]|uniref:Glycosyltransferase RgtA/B/C/D-like domain-containing protein n=1 Tax=invertebrate metagenome TaxID=1711999 RepID=A0A2H9T880_9ZZZZ